MSRQQSPPRTLEQSLAAINAARDERLAREEIERRHLAAQEAHRRMQQQEAARLAGLDAPQVAEPVTPPSRAELQARVGAALGEVRHVVQTLQGQGHHMAPIVGQLNLIGQYLRDAINAPR